MRVTDEMVDAAIAADSHASWWASNNREGTEKRMRAALEAALAVEGTKAEPVAYQLRESLDGGETWSDWDPSNREAFDKYISLSRDAGLFRFQVRPLYTTPPAEGTPKVKALEWEKDWRGDLDDIPAWRAETPVGRLSFSVHGYSSHDAAPIERTEAAKAEIQSAYEKRVLSCLEYTTPPAGIREALETAIQHIEHMAAWIGKQNTGYSFESLGEDMDGMRAALRGQS